MDEVAAVSIPCLIGSSSVMMLCEGAMRGSSVVIMLERIKYRYRARKGQGSRYGKSSIGLGPA